MFLIGEHWCQNKVRPESTTYFLVSVNIGQDQEVRPQGYAGWTAPGASSRAQCPSMVSWKEEVELRMELQSSCRGMLHPGILFETGMRDLQRVRRSQAQRGQAMQHGFFVTFGLFKIN
jgi:hypothetical protein